MQTQPEGPFVDPAQGAGTRGAELGTHRWSHNVSPAGIEPGTFRLADVRLVNDAIHWATEPVLIKMCARKIKDNTLLDVTR